MDRFTAGSMQASGVMLQSTSFQGFPYTIAIEDLQPVMPDDKIKNMNIDLDNADFPVRKNRISDIEQSDRKRPGIKKPIILISALALLLVAAIVIITKYIYDRPKALTGDQKPVAVPFENIQKNTAPQSENIRIKRGIESYTRGYLNDAISEFNEVLESNASDKDKAIALTYLGIISDDRGNHTKAVEYYNRALTYNREGPDIYRNLALSHRASKDYEKAEQYAEKALALNPRDVNSLILLGNIYYEMNKYKEAIRVYGQALDLSPDNPSVLYNMGSALVKTGDEFSAIEYFKKAGTADRIGEVAYKAYSRLGVLYTERMDYLNAEKYLEQALAIRPQDAVNNYNMGIAYFKQNKTDKALEMFENAEKYGARDMQMMENVGEAYFSLNQFDRSLAAYNRILLTSQRNVRILSRIGDIYYRKGELDRAYDSFRRITEIEPATENARIAYLNMGNIMDDAQRYEDAIRAYQKALSISPKDAAAHHNLGIAYKHAGKPELALQSWKEASRLDTSTPGPAIAMADYYSEKGFYDLAEKEYQNIATRWQNQQDVHFKLATIYYKRNSLTMPWMPTEGSWSIDEKSDLARKAYINMAVISVKLKGDEDTMSSPSRC